MWFAISITHGNLTGIIDGEFGVLHNTSTRNGCVCSLDKHEAINAILVIGGAGASFVLHSVLRE